MSEGGGAVRFEPDVMVKSAFTLLGVAGDVGDAGTAVEGLPQAGIPPELATRVCVVLYDAGNDLGAAFHAVDRDARTIISTAAKAVALDAAGDLCEFAVELRLHFKEFAEDVNHPTWVDAVGAVMVLAERRAEFSKAQREAVELAAKVKGHAGTLKQAEKYWAEHPNLHGVFNSAEDLQRRLGLLDKVPAGLRKSPLVKVVPGASDFLNYVAGRSEGRSAADAAEKAATQRVFSVAAGSITASVCGALAVGTFGAAAPSCPFLTAGAAVGGDYLAGKAYDPIVRPALHAAADVGKATADAAVGGGKKVVHFVGGLFH